mgnify:CR=1 FL=1
MALGNLSLNTLRAFDASARHLNFTRAADELCVTQAAVAHQVKALEEHIGRALFRRTARGLVLTDEGVEVLGSALGHHCGALAEHLGSRIAPADLVVFERVLNELRRPVPDGPDAVG